MFDIYEHISTHLHKISKQNKDQWRKTFATDNVVVLSDILSPVLQTKFEEEAKSLLQNHARRRELFIKESGDTERAYNSVGRDEIRQDGVFIPSVFDSDAFREFLCDIAGEELHRVPYAPEEFIINSQSKPNDTHGWHWDDYAFALIWCIDEPDPLFGGRVEYVPRIIWDKNEPKKQLIDILRNRQVNSFHVKKNECYLMKANTCLHRVAPLTQETNRTVVVMTYASTRDLYDVTITHLSMEEIYQIES